MRASVNNIGVIRLALASAVVVSHSVEFIDGSRAKEPLTRVFHTLSLGDLAVAGFFLLSGFLITSSFMHTRSANDFLLRRLLRIVPGFLLAYGVSIFVVGPLLGHAPLTNLPRVLLDAVTLRDPMLDGVHLNEPAWTIIYEMRCYLLTMVLGLLGLLRRRRLILGLTVLSVLAAFVGEHWIAKTVFQPLERLPAFEEIFGGLQILLRLAACYMVGSTVFLYLDRLQNWLTGRVALVGLLGSAALFAIDVPFACFGLSTFFAASLFWLALKAKLGPLQAVNHRWDISYGVYLYGWLVQTMLVGYVGGIDAVEFSAAALVGVGGVVGSLIGSRLLRRLPIRWLRWLFLLLLVAVALRILLVAPSRGADIPIDPGHAAGLVLLGLAMGVASGLFGIGGGVIVVPVLMALFGADDLLAKGTSLAAMIVTAFAGTVGNWRAGLVRPLDGVVLGIAAVVASFGGVATAVVLSPFVANVLFAVLIVASAAQLLLAGLRERRAQRLEDAERQGP